MPSGEYINIQSGGILHLFQNEMGYSKKKCTETKKNRLNVQPDFLRASCRIRTNDPEITNHVLWPTELKRQVGKLTISRRYNQLPLLRSSPGGFEGSWPYGTYPCYVLLSSELYRCFSIAGAKVGIFLKYTSILQ